MSELIVKMEDAILAFEAIEALSSDEGIQDITETALPELRHVGLKIRNLEARNGFLKAALIKFCVAEESWREFGKGDNDDELDEAYRDACKLLGREEYTGPNDQPAEPK